ncbi:MAG TPA: lipoyl synthase [Armatimonadota bacterium]|nr:lipoyl synthase [Armatimonadota bacterium]
MNRRLPEWLTVKAPKRGAYEEMAGYLESLGLHTVCQSASCPNIGECFSRRTATFMILGDTCTRSCGFCGVRHGEPLAVDPDEPRRVAQAAAQLGLKYVVVTSVSRDDLSDGGASQFAETIRQIRAHMPDAGVEVLVPDFGGDADALKAVLDAGPFVLNHNVETVPRLYGTVRPAADYGRSLRLLETAKQIEPSIYTKSGFMVGLGESKEEVEEVLRDLRSAGCDIVTIGQYLRPSKANLPVVEYVLPARFDEYKVTGDALGFRYVASGPFVRSSYHAEDIAGV